jgi:hypothetical protein
MKNLTKDGEVGELEMQKLMGVWRVEFQLDTD